MPPAHRPPSSLPRSYPRVLHRPPPTYRTAGGSTAAGAIGAGTSGALASEWGAASGPACAQRAVTGLAATEHAVTGRAAYRCAADRRAADGRAADGRSPDGRAAALRAVSARATAVQATAVCAIARRTAAIVIAASTCLTLAAAPAKAASDWQLVGRLGKAQYIVVPESHARDRAYYERVIAEACPDRGTCFLRFFTNTQAAPLGLPLPDAIQNEATLIFSRSAKMAAEELRWSCRLQVPEGSCF